MLDIHSFHLTRRPREAALPLHLNRQAPEPRFGIPRGCLSLWTNLPELIPLFEVFHCTLTNTEFSQGLSETVVQKFAIQMQCSAGWRTGPLPRAQLSPAPPAPAVSSSNLSLFLDGPADSGFAPEESKQLVSSRLCLSTGTQTTDAKAQMDCPQTTMRLLGRAQSVGVSTALLERFVI